MMTGTMTGMRGMNGAKPILPEAKPHGLRWTRKGRRERREMDERNEAKPILPEAKPHG